MTMTNQRLLEDLAARRQPGRCSTSHLAAWPPAGREVELTPTADGAHESADVDLVEAERLISDLAALVEAGLVVVEPRVLGPARYAVGPDLEDAA
jgi:hypothetical protein